MSSPNFLHRSCSAGAIFLRGISRKFPIKGQGFGPAGKGSFAPYQFLRRRTSNISRPSKTTEVEIIGRTLYELPGPLRTHPGGRCCSEKIGAIYLSMNAGDLKEIGFGIFIL